MCGLTTSSWLPWPASIKIFSPWAQSYQSSNLLCWPGHGQVFCPGLEEVCSGCWFILQTWSRICTIWNTITDMYDKGNHLREWRRKFLAEMLFSRLQSKVRETLNNAVKAWVFLCWWCKHQTMLILTLRFMEDKVVRNHKLFYLFEKIYVLNW